MKRSRAFPSVLILTLSLLAIAVPANSQDTIRITVSATDQAGAPLMTLAKPDFSIQESGKARAITTFAGPGAKPAAPPQLQPNEFSNVPDSRETSGAIFVVLDTIDTRAVDERDERVMILKFLGKAAQAKHAVTLGILSDKGLNIYHDYRTGSDVLLAAMSKAGLGGMKGVAPPAGVSDADVNAEVALLTAFSKGDQSNPTPPGTLLRSNVDMPMIMFQDIGFAASGLPGRKSLVWVTNAISFDIDAKTMQFKSTKIQSAGVAVNGEAVGGTKDALSAPEIKRLSAMWRHGIRALLDGGVAIYPVEVRGSVSAGSDAFTIARMKELALLTGGKPFTGSNDPFPDILATSNANTAGYVLSFAAESNAVSDFRPVEVTPTSQNIVVSHPAGYFPYEGTPKSQATDEIALAMGSPLEYTGIRFKVAVSSIEEGAGGKKKVNLVITLPGDSGILDEATGSVDVGFVARAVNAAGQTVGTMNEGAGGKFPPEAAAHIKETGFQLKRSFEVSPGDCTVRFLVRDNQTGRMGDVIFPLNVK